MLFADRPAVDLHRFRDLCERARNATPEPRMGSSLRLLRSFLQAGLLSARLIVVPRPVSLRITTMMMPMPSQMLPPILAWMSAL